MDQTGLGEVERDGDTVVLRYQRTLGHAPQKVWRAITESDHLRHWFPADIIGERSAGAELKIAFWPEAIEQAGEEIEASGLALDNAVLPGRVLAWQPPELFEFTWDTEHLRFELAPDGSGTKLSVTIRVAQPGPRGFASTATGYHVCIDALVAHLDGETADIFDEALIADLEAKYAALLGE